MSKHTIYALSGLAAFAVLSVAVWWFAGSRNAQAITSFAECAAAGYPVMESDPRRCAAPDGASFSEDVAKDRAPPPAATSDCAPAGCSSQLCVEAKDAANTITTCEFRPEYACYRDAVCARQADGRCGWSETPQLRACLQDPPQAE